MHLAQRLSALVDAYLELHIAASPRMLPGDLGVGAVKLWKGAATTGARERVAMVIRDIAAPQEASATATWVGAPIGPNRSASPSANGLLLNFMNVPAQHAEEFNAWYDSEHIPRLSAVPGVLAARRFAAVVGDPYYLAIYHLSDAAIVGTDAWRAASRTPWTDRVRNLHRDHRRLLLEAV